MHGCSSGSVILVNAEFDSMGGVVDGGAGIGVKTSPRRAEIEKAQAELRQEYDVREERRRELEFLEKGGNPLDFELMNAVSLSVQSTSLTEQHPEQLVTSEVEGSLALAASAHGDYVESSVRPGTRTFCEPNSADNLLLFDGENELPENKKIFIRPGKRNSIAPSKHSYHARESEDSTNLRPYARRNRSKSNRDGARSSSTDIVQSRGGHGSMVSCVGSGDAKGSICEPNKQKDQNVPSISNPKSASSNGDMVPKIETSDKQVGIHPDGEHGELASRSVSKGSLPECNLQVIALKVGIEPQLSQIDDQELAVDVDSERPDAKEQDASDTLECPPCAVTTGTLFSEIKAGSGPVDGLNNLKLDRKAIPDEMQNRNATCAMKGLDSKSSCTQTSLCMDVNNDSDVCTNQRNVDDENSAEQKSKYQGLPNLVSGEIVREMNETKAVVGNDDGESINHDYSGKGSLVKIEEEIHPTVFGEQNTVKHPNMEGGENNVHGISKSDKTAGNVSAYESNINKENSSTDMIQSSLYVSAGGPPATTFLVKNSASESKQLISDDHLKLANKAHEDSVLEEARIIQAKRRRIAELSVSILPLENLWKSHWDFVLEEMAWLANDFAQEHLWKITAASQMCRLAASASWLKLEQQSQYRKLKKVSHTMANAVMQFWRSAEMLLSTDISSVDLKNEKHDSTSSGFIDGNETMEDKIEEPKMKTIKELEQSPIKSPPLLQAYAVRFLKSTTSPVTPLQAEAPATPERTSDLGITEMSWEDHLTEESLFYTVPSGAMELYRKSIESNLVQSKKTCSGMQEVETHMDDAAAEYGYQDSTYKYNEDEGETSTYYLPGLAQKKQKNLMKSSSARLYEMPTDVPYGHLATGAQHFMVMGKRPANNLNVGAIPTKQMRTASRQRVLCAFGAGGTGGVQAPAKTDASSGDTNSFQDDQSTMCGGSQIQKGSEVESPMKLEQQMPYDSAETSTKPKKKKPKHMVHKNSYILSEPGDLLISGKGTAYELGWQLDSTVHSEQRDHFKRRTESHQFDSNETSGLYGHHNVKRPKIMKQPLDNAFDNMNPMASRGNMSNPNKFIKLMGGRDRGRKAKGLKISVCQPGSGSPWSLFEDQALVVLVHDMGLNWELVSDAFNSTLQFKCIFRKQKECKERHKILMDRSAGDGADSAEDSGSSQSYPSTLPGIPKGSARQLFQCLQGPMVEDTLKSHFGKIIAIGQKQHYRRSQNHKQNPKQIAQVHNSHVIALSQAFPNNQNGSILSPLDLCDTTPSSPDVLPLGYPGSQIGGLPMSNQGSAASMLPTSGPNSSVQGSSGTVLGSNLQPTSGPLSASVRFGAPRPSSPTDEHQRTQLYNEMLSGRNIQKSNLSVPGTLSGTDRGARMNGVGVMPRMNRSMPMARPGLQGMTPSSSSVLNSGGMLSSAMYPGQSALRPGEALQMVRPSHNAELQRQTMVPEPSMQVSQGNSQGKTHFNGLSAPLPNQTAPRTQQHQMSPQQPHLQGPNHASGSQQQAYAMRIAKERQQQQFVAPNSLLPHTQAHPQHLVSPSQPVSLPPLTPSSPMAPLAPQLQQKHHLQSGHGRNSQTPNNGLTDHMGKQRPRQFQQPGRHHPQQRPLAQSQQPKTSKSIGRGNMNLPVDSLYMNGLTVAAGSQSVEKGDQVMHPVQNQGPYPGSLNSVQPSKPSVPSQSSNQPQQMPSHSDNGAQSQATQLASPQMLQKPVSENQPTVQRMLQQNRQAQGKSPVSNAPGIGMTSATPRTCIDSTNVRPVMSSAIAPQWKASEPVCDSSLQNIETQVAIIGSEPILPVNLGLGQRQSSGSLPLQGHKNGTEWHQQPQVQQSSKPPPVPHLSQQPLEQPPPPLQEQQQDKQSSPTQLPSQRPSQQQTQHLQSEQGNLYIKPTTSELEGAN